VGIGVATTAGHEIKKNAGFLARNVISQALQETLNLDHIVRLSLESLKPHFEGAQLACSLFSTDGDSLHPVWVSSQSGGGDQFMHQEGLLWKVSLEATTQANTRNPDGYQLSFIENESRKYGVMVLVGGDRAMFELVKFISQGFQQVALEIEETSDVHRLTRELEILNRTAKSLTTSLDLDTILVAIMQGVWELFPEELAILTLIDFDRDELHIKIPLTGDPNHVARFEPDEVSGIVGNCLENRATSVVPDVGSDGRFDPEVDSVPGKSPQSLMCVPLLTHDRTLGALSILSDSATAFGKKDLNLLLAFGASVSVAISNARFLHEVTSANADLEDSRREIEQSRNTLLALFDNLDDELYIIDRDYQLIAVNKTRAKRTGSTPQDLVAGICYQVLENRDSPCPACLARQTFDHGRKTMRIENSIGKDHQFIIREIYTYPIIDAEGKVFQSILQLRDITEQRRMEASLIQAEKLAALGQLSAGVAHELNNPITAVIANTQLLKRELEPVDLDSESVDLIEQAGRRAQKVVRALLDFSRQEPYEFHPVDINQSILHALALVEKQWEKANIKLIQELDSGLPQIHGNTDHLQSVWLNLLVNAKDALEGGAGEVTLRTEKKGDFVIIQVADTGKGIPQEYINRIFDPFFTTKAPGKGTGLGLATCFRIIDQHRGTIEVESTLNVGTTFTVKLPIDSPKDLRAD
jgi:two-component system NtrC family sensor kinase